MFHQSESRSPRGWAAATVLVLTGALAGTAWCDPPAQRELPATDRVAQAGASKKSDLHVKVTATGEKPDAQGKQVINLMMQIDKGWHIYANPVKNESQDSVQTTVAVSAKVKPLGLNVVYPPGQLVKDKDFGDYMAYTDQVAIKAVVQRAQGDTGPLELNVRFQACSENSCLPPATVKVAVP